MDARAFPTPLEEPLPFPPQRVVSLVPSLTESLFDLDLGDRLIAVTEYCTRPAERVAALPKVGGPKSPDVTRIVALAPHLVLMGEDENRLEDAQALAEAGLRLWVARPRSVQDALNLLWAMMEVFEHPRMIPRVREIERARDYTFAAAEALPQRTRVFVPLWREPWMTFNRHTYAHDVLHTCGGANVFADHPERYPKIALEDVVAAQPEVVLLPSEPCGFTETDAATFRALEIPAAKNDRVHLVEGSLLSWYGTRLAYALRDLPPLLMPAASPWPKA